MAKNITLMGADYPDVPAVQLPQTGGGTATFYDINVIDSLDSSSETDALSANQGRVLFNYTKGIKRFRGASATSGRTFSIPNGSRLLLLTSDSIANGHNMWFISTNSSGALRSSAVYTSGALTLTQNTSGTITLTGNGLDPYIMFVSIKDEDISAIAEIT